VLHHIGSVMYMVRTDLHAGFKHSSKYHVTYMYKQWWLWMASGFLKKDL